MADLPSVDDFFGGQAPKRGVPTVDDFFGSQQQSSDPTSSVAIDEAMSRTKLGGPMAAIGRTLNAFGEGAKEAWGTARAGQLDPETEDFMKKMGWLNDYKGGQGSLIKGFNEAIMRPAAGALSTAMRGISAGFAGAEQAAFQAGKEVGAPGLGELGAELIEAGGFGALHGVTNVPHVPEVPPSLPEARSLGVIGEGEGGWQGTRTPEPQTEAQRAEALREHVESLKEAEPAPETPAVSQEPVPAGEAQATAPAPDIHQMARSIAPDDFQQYDNLSTRADTFRRWLGELRDQRQSQAEASAPNTAEIADLRARLDDPDTTPRLQKKYQARLSVLEPENQAYIDQATQGDSADMARVRQALMDNDYQMRDLSPRIAAAYRQAKDQIPEEAIAPEAIQAETPATESEQVVRPEEENASPVSQEEQGGIQPAEVPPVRGPANENAVQNIAQDVSKKLKNAGRSSDEADAAAQIIAAHYEARAARFAGAKGSAEDLYNLDAPDIREGGVGGRKGMAAGKTTIKDAQSTIMLFSKADASTFMHETGHHWLEEMMRDANDEAATDVIKNDAQSVRDWLGAKEGEEITGRQHEKFARGFERYLMEGVAPSEGLARVFAQFKDWLTKIYQVVTRLRSPITDEIRDVFDRLIMAEPKKTVIAPERTAERDMADIHEEEAESTPPERSAGAADKIRGEIDELAKKQAPEIYDELNPNGPTGGVAPPNEGVAGGSPEAGSIARENGIPAESRTVPAGGDEVAAESGELRSRTNAIGAQLPKPGESPDGPNERFGKPESNLIDKAGNIRLDNLGTPDDVNDVIHMAASQNGDFWDARRGVISDAQALDLADALGMDVSTLNLRKIGQAFNAEEILAARKLLIQSATKVRDLMAAAARYDAPDEAVMAYAEAKTRHVMIQEHVAAITAEAGRALRAFRRLEGSEETQQLGDFLKQSTGKTLFQLRQEAQLGQTLDTPQKVSKFLNDSKKATFSNMLLEYWINGLISGPATHTTYAIGNTLLAMWKAIPETGVAAVLGKLRGTEEGAIRLGEIGAQLRGAKEGLPSALSAAGQALKSGVTTLLPGEEARAMPFQPGAELAIPGQVANEMTWHELGSQTFGAIKGLRDAFVSTGELVKQGGIEGAPLIGTKASSLGSIPDITVRGVRALPVGSVIRAPGRAIAAIHSFFRTANYSMQKAALAYRAASDEGLQGEQFAARVGDLVTNPTEEMMKNSIGEATELTLMGRGGEFTAAVSRLTNTRIFGFPLLKFIDPFVHIGANVIEQSIVERTPIGLLSPEIRADLKGINGPAARDMASARMLVGTALGITVGGLAAEGLVSGSGPSNPREAWTWRILGGNQAHSVKIGEMWYDVHRLGPLGMILGITADMYDVTHAATHEDLSKTAALVVHAITQNVLDESFMRGPSELIEALSDSDRYGDAYVRNMVSSFVPYSVGMAQIARSIDPYTRQARTTVDAIKAKIPGLSESLYPKRDLWGEPIPNRDALGPEGFSAIYESKATRDPVNLTLLHLGVNPSQPSRKIRGVPLTDQQYDDFSRISGRLAKMRLDALVATPGFSDSPEGIQIELIKKVVDSSRETARSVIMMDNPAIIRQAIQNKIAKIHGPQKEEAL